MDKNPLWHFPCFPICFPFRSHFRVSPSPFHMGAPWTSLWGAPQRVGLWSLTSLRYRCRCQMVKIRFLVGDEVIFNQPPKMLIYWYGSWKWWVNPRIGIWLFWFFSVSRLSNNWSSFKVFRSSSKSSFGQHESWALAWPSSLNLCCFLLWSDSGRDTNSTISIFRLEALAYIDHGSSLNHLSGMPLCLMPQADPWRSLDRAGDKKRSVAHEMEHHIRLLVGHIVGIGQPGNEITTSGQDVLKKCRLPKKTGSYKCF